MQQQALKDSHIQLDSRFWEIDALRGVAIIMMVIFHLTWDLGYFRVVDVNVFQGGWLVLQRTTATTFLLLVGMSLPISDARARLTHRPNAAVWRRQLRRGLTVLAWGMGVSLVLQRHFRHKAPYIVFDVNSIKSMMLFIVRRARAT